MQKKRKFEWEGIVDFWRREKRGNQSFFLEKEGFHTMDGTTMKGIH
jgi:hypothetical protein